MNRRRATFLCVGVLAVAVCLGASMCGPQLNASFTVEPFGGAPPLEVRFDATGSTPGMDLYEWDFGDGTQGEGVIVDHTYTQLGEYSVVLWIHERFEESDRAIETVFCVQGPDVVFTTTPSTGEAPLLVSFDGQQTTPPVGARSSFGGTRKYYVIQTLVWDFGDGTTETWENNLTAFFYLIYPPKPLSKHHTYNDPGTYTVTLTVTDVFGLIGSAERQIIVGGADAEPDDDPIEEDLEENFELGAILWELDDEEEEDCIFIEGSVQNDGIVAAGVELTATAYNAIGAPVGTFTYWPAGSTNISSGVDYAFSFFLCDLSVPGEQVVTVEVVVTDAIVY